MLTTRPSAHVSSKSTMNKSVPAVQLWPFSSCLCSGIVVTMNRFHRSRGTTSFCCMKERTLLYDTRSLFLGQVIWRPELPLHAVPSVLMLSTNARNSCAEAVRSAASFLPRVDASKVHWFEASPAGCSSGTGRCALFNWNGLISAAPMGSIECVGLSSSITSTMAGGLRSIQLCSLSNRPASSSSLAAPTLNAR